MTETPEDEESTASHKEAVDLVVRALRGLRYGEVRVVVQDGVVVQVERTERFRPARRRKA